MTIKVLMVPSLSNFDKEENGIKQVVAAYTRYLPDYDVKLVDDASCDLIAVHAGTYRDFPNRIPMVAHLHGLYWTSDYSAAQWEWRTNAEVVASIIRAQAVTVPSEWVAETLRRDMHMNPAVVPHGIDWQDWQENTASEGYVLWNKNRTSDVCNPEPVGELANHFPETIFITTFGPRRALPNIKIIGLQPHDVMKKIVKMAGVYLTTVKETFGVGVLEALASGVPVLGFRYGGNCIAVQHGVNGYLARPGDYEDLAQGLRYCLQHRKVLSDNARESVRSFTWQNAVEKLVKVYQGVLVKDERPYRL